MHVDTHTGKGEICTQCRHNWRKYLGIISGVSFSLAQRSFLLCLFSQYFSSISVYMHFYLRYVSGSFIYVTHTEKTSFLNPFTIFPLSFRLISYFFHLKGIIFVHTQVFVLLSLVPFFFLFWRVGVGDDYLWFYVFAASVALKLYLFRCDKNGLGLNGANKGNAWWRWWRQQWKREKNWREHNESLNYRDVSGRQLRKIGSSEDKCTFNWTEGKKRSKLHCTKRANKVWVWMCVFSVLKKQKLQILRGIRTKAACGSAIRKINYYQCQTSIFVSFFVHSFFIRHIQWSLGRFAYKENALT